MDLYHLYPVLQVRKINLQVPPSDIAHERSQSEPVYGAPPSDQINSDRFVVQESLLNLFIVIELWFRRASGDRNNHVTEEDGFASYPSKGLSINNFFNASCIVEVQSFFPRFR